MTRPAASKTRRKAGGSIVAALMFNGAALAIPFAGAGLVNSLSGELIDYAPSKEAIRSTRSALAAEAVRFAPRGSEARRQEWSNLVARELGENDAAAARGFALNALDMLGSSDAASVRRAMRTDVSDEALLAAALPLVDPYLRPRFRTLIAGGGRGNFDNLGDAQATATLSERWLAGESIDAFLFKLGGLTLPTPDAPADDVRLGAATIKIAKTGGHLNARLSAYMEAAVASAVPDDRLRAELSAAFQNRAAIVDEGAAAASAFRRATDPSALAALTEDLAHIGAAARAASPAGAAMLLAHARDARDLRKVELLAVAGAERAVAIGKRSPEGLVLHAARGQLKRNPQLWTDVASVSLLLLTLLIATHMAVMAALRSEWEGEPPPAPVAPTMSKAEAQRRARQPEHV